MSASNETKEDHGSGKQQELQRREGHGGGHSGHGAASALAVFNSRKQEQQGGESGDAAGGAQ